VDIIASKENVLHFIEVKTRTGNVFGHPEEQVDRRKMENILSAADEFQETYPEWKRIQFDILSISLQRPIEYFFIEDVFL
jgi:putative endonuclease